MAPLIRPLGRGRLTGDRKGRPYEEAGELPRRAGEDTRPYGGKQTGDVDSAKPGARVGPEGSALKHS